MEAKEKRWDLKRNSKIFSYLRFGEVKKLIFKDLIKEDDLIWHPGLSGWRKAGGQEELKPFFKKAGKKQK